MRSYFHLHEDTMESSEIVIAKRVDDVILQAGSHQNTFY